VKKILLFSGLLCLLASCAPTRPSYPGSASAPPPERRERDPQFLENITINQDKKEETVINKPPALETRKHAPGVNYSNQIEHCNELQFKYAILLETNVESMNDARLITFLEHWYGAPYRYGGETKKGIDCSAFTSMMMDSVYDIQLPRTAQNQYNSTSKIKKDDLSQGDLVFFNTTGGISHVGVYLANNKFVHASVSSGVMVSDMDDGYFKRRYVGATRVK
jgi:cell wall-associated NlpC family hydrolase